MLILKKIKTPKRVLNIDINPNRFKAIWIDALRDKKSNLTNLIIAIKPFVTKLSKDIENNNFTYYYAGILNLVNIDTSISLQKKEIWLENINSKIESELYFMVIKRCREIKKIPYNASPEMCEYYFMTDLKYQISKSISRVKDSKSIPNNISSSVEEEKETIIEDLWYNYLYKFYKYGYNKKEISQTTSLSRQTIYVEEKKLCHYLKKKQSTI